MPYSSSPSHIACHHAFYGWPGKSFRHTTNLNAPVALNPISVNLMAPAQLNGTIRLADIVTQTQQRVKNHAKQARYARVDEVNGELGKYHGKIHLLEMSRHKLARKYGGTVARQEARLKELQQDHQHHEDLYAAVQAIRTTEREALHRLNPVRAALRLAEGTHAIGHKLNVARMGRTARINLKERRLGIEQKIHGKLAGNGEKIKQRAEADRIFIAAQMQNLRNIVTASPQARIRVISEGEARKISSSPKKQTALMRAFSASPTNFAEYWPKLFDSKSNPDTAMENREMLRLFNWCHDEVVEASQQKLFAKTGKRIIDRMHGNRMNTMAEMGKAEEVRAKLKAGQKAFEALRTEAIGPSGQTSGELDKMNKLHAVNPRAAYMLLEAAQAYGQTPEELTNALRIILTTDVIDAATKTDRLSTLALLKITDKVNDVYAKHVEGVTGRLQKIKIEEINKLVPVSQRTQLAFAKDLATKAKGKSLYEIAFSILDGNLLGSSNRLQKQGDQLAVFAAAKIIEARTNNESVINWGKNITQDTLTRLTQTP